MKKILSILVLIAFVVSANAQQSPKLATTTSYGNTLDTVVNTATKVTTATKVASWYANAAVNAHVILTKISGTVGGSMGLYGSMDGANWTLCGSAQTPSDASANYYFSTTNRYFYYRISYTGATTQSASIKTYFLY
jgi:hypothetical protein